MMRTEICFTVLGLAVSVPLYICEANLGGVELIHQMTKRLQDAGLGTTTVINNSTQAFSNSINNSTEGPSSNSTAAHPRIGMNVLYVLSTGVIFRRHLFHLWFCEWQS